MSEESMALVPVDQRQVDFYGDELTAVLIETEGKSGIYVPVRPISDYLGLAWSGQYERIQRDPILSEALTIVRLTRTNVGNPNVVALPLKFIPGWLFGINVNRIREALREKILRYQRECYDVLAEAFEEGRLTADPTLSQLMAANTPAVQTYRMLQAMTRLARQQVLMEARFAGRLDEHERRLEQIEATLGDPGRHVTPEQASQISQAVKGVAMKLSERTGRNEYGGVYGELYRRFGITSYKQLPAERFEEAMEWLTAWYGGLAGDVPF